ncbi:MAG: zinc ABC transporter substrate-binding protein [Pseudomonadota bacterium]
MGRPLKAFVVILALCLTTGGVQAQDRPRIVAVNYALQYFAERLVGDVADVVFPVPDSIDPSFWRPSIADISMIQSADLILLNGAGFATWIDRVSLPRSRLVNTSAAIEDRFIVTESITHSHGDGGEHSHDGLASYTWLDPTLAIEQAAAIAGAVSAKNLASPEDVFANFADLRADLEELDAQAATELEAAQGVALISTHPRYEYFAQRYGLSIAALEWEAGAAPTEAQIGELQALVDETGAGILIWEAEPPSESIDAASALGLKSVVFDPLARAEPSGPYIEAYMRAVTEIAAAAALSSN